MTRLLDAFEAALAGEGLAAQATSAGTVWCDRVEPARNCCIPGLSTPDRAAIGSIDLRRQPAPASVGSCGVMALTSARPARHSPSRTTKPY